MNRKRLFTTQEPPPLGMLDPTLIKVRPVVRLVPTTYPVALIPPADAPVQPPERDKPTSTPSEPPTPQIERGRRGEQ